MFNQCVHCEAPSGTPCDENCITRVVDEEEAPATEPAPKIRIQEQEFPALCKQAYYGLECSIPNCGKCAALKNKKW